MIFLKVVVLLFLSLDVYIGGCFLLNVLNLLQTSKYSKTATLLYAIVFITLALAGFYTFFVQKNITVCLWISIAPWAVILVFLLLNMIFGDYK